MASFRTDSRFGVVAPIVLLIAAVSSGAEHITPFAGGTGEPNDPYQIATAEQLIAIGSDPNLLDRNLILTADIDLDPNLPGGQVFQRAVIAPDEKGADANDLGFTGSFDGQGFKVRNLTIDARGLEVGPLGLFGRIGTGGSVHHLGIEKVAICADENSSGVAGLVGINSGDVEACYVGGSVSGGSNVGGLCGENLGIIQSCYSTVTVSGEDAVGGLVGCNSRLRPIRPYSSPTPDARRYSAGGIVRCYSAGAVSGRGGVGGLLGWLVGQEAGAGWSNFWDIDVSDLGFSGAGIGLTTPLMMDGAIFAAHGWDQDSNWVIEDGKDYPRLAWEQTNGQPIQAGVSDRFDGTGAAADPYWVGTAEKFALIGLVPELWDKHFVLGADLDLTAVRLYPVGWSEREPYDGFFHGNGHVLRNVSITAAGSENVGVFGAIGENGRISHLGLESVTITAGPEALGVGTLAGRNDGVITGCYATGTIGGEQALAVGGLAGVNMGRIAYSYAVVDVAEPISAGGLTSGGPGVILECYSAGAVKDADGKRDIVDGRCDLVLNSYFAAEPDDPELEGIVRRPRPVEPSPPRMGWPLSDAEMRRKESFLGWDFAGSQSDGLLDRWFMPDANYPILSWQVDLDGLRPIPDIAGLSPDWARAELEVAGFVVGEFLYDYHSTIPREAAILASPVGLASPGSIVDIVLSQGRYIPSQVSISRGLRSWYYLPIVVEIETPGQVECLAWIMNQSSNFVLSRDIDMAGWEALPIDADETFAGTFFGNGHKIFNLKTFRRGLFNRISSEGLVYGLRLENMVVGDPDAARLGILASVNEGTVMNSAATGVIIGSEATLNLGGLVGENRGVISECFAGATSRGRHPEPSGVEPDRALMPAHGGLVGMNAYAIVDCYAAGDVSGTGYVASLVGDNYASISRCYAAARVSGQSLENTGGLVGHSESRYRSRTGGGTPPPVTDCYFLSPTLDGGPDNGTGIPLTDEQMRQQASFVGWDFESVWMICEGEDYPRLQWENVACTDESIAGDQ